MAQKHIVVEDSLSCCGMAEIDGISEYQRDPDGERMAIDILTDRDFDWEKKKDIIRLYIPFVGHLIFTQAGNDRKRDGYGYKLMRYIRDNDLGTVVVSAPGANPNHEGRFVHVFVWTMNKRGIRAWARKLKIKV